jgi:hypothetical protein
MSDNKTSRETLTKDDLNRIFIRAQDERGKWDSISIEEATDKQFQEWANSRMTIVGEDMAWPPEERADFCDRLWQDNALTILKKEVPEVAKEEEQEIPTIEPLAIGGFVVCEFGECTAEGRCRCVACKLFFCGEHCEYLGVDTGEEEYICCECEEKE